MDTPPHLVEFVRLSKKIYGNDYLVLKEDCVGHIQKRMGSYLRKYKRDVKGKLSDEGTVGDRGSVTDAVIDKFQNYYGAAKINNKNSLNKINDALWAIYYHRILCENEPLSQQH